MADLVLSGALLLTAAPQAPPGARGSGALARRSAILVCQLGPVEFVAVALEAEFAQVDQRLLAFGPL